MSLAHGEVPNTLVTSFPLYRRNQLQECPGGFRGASSANHVHVLLHKSSAEGGGGSGEGFQHLFLVFNGFSGVNLWFWAPPAGWVLERNKPWG